MIIGYTFNENAAFNGYVSKNETSPPPSFGTQRPGSGIDCLVKAEIEYVISISLSVLSKTLHADCLSGGESSLTFRHIAIYLPAISPTSLHATGWGQCTAVSLFHLVADHLLSLPADIPIAFGTHYQFRGNSTELEWQTSFAMQGMSKNRKPENLS